MAQARSTSHTVNEIVGPEFDTNAEDNCTTPVTRNVFFFPTSTSRSQTTQPLRVNNVSLEDLCFWKDRCKKLYIENLKLKALLRRDSKFVRSFRKTK